MESTENIVDSKDTTENKGFINLDFEDGGLVGRGTKEKGGFLELDNVLVENTPHYGGAFEKVLIRTESGNIYYLGLDGRFIDSAECKKNGKLIDIELNTKELKGRKIVVGENFQYGKNSKTGKVVEIATLGTKTYDEELTEKLKKNAIKTDIKKIFEETIKGVKKDELQLPVYTHNHN